jgi:hypothetical protein
VPASGGPSDWAAAVGTAAMRPVKRHRRRRALKIVWEKRVKKRRGL